MQRLLFFLLAITVGGLSGTVAMAGLHQADPRIAEKTLAKLQGDGVDAYSRVVDPLFVDPDNGDFRFEANSPALEMGITQIDVSKIGLVKK